MTITHQPNFYIITGGPAAGKTTVLRELQQQGYCCVPEGARGIIQQQVAIDGSALPWDDTFAYTSLMLQKSIDDYTVHSGTDFPCFFDRGIPDVAAYAALIQLPHCREINAVAAQLRYNTTVFILPPWESIFENDAERKQTFAEAVETYHTLAKVYSQLGYTLVTVPPLSPVQRATFILQAI